MLKLLRFLKPYAPLVAAILALLFGQAMAELYMPTIMSEVVNEGMLKGNNDYILFQGSRMLMVALLSSACAVTGSFISARVAMGFGRDLRDAVFTKVEGCSLASFEKIGTSSLITRTTNDIVQIQMVLVMMMRFMIYAPIMSVGGYIMAISKDRELARVLYVAIPLLLALMGFTANYAMPLFIGMQKRLDNLNLVMRESLTGIRVIRAFNKLEREYERFEKANDELTSNAIRINKIMATMQPIMMLMMHAVTISIIWFGGLRIDTGSLGLGDMMAFMQYAMQILFSFIMVSITFIMLPRAQASATRINEALELTDDIADPVNPVADFHRRGSVRYENVGFRYPGSEEHVLRDINFETGPGEVSAIIGGTGSGKSTLINLLPRFYDVTEGRVLVDDVDVRDMTQETLRAKIGFIPQTAVLFSGTVSENIRTGKPDATDEEIRAAALTAQADGFIAATENGYEHIVSQGGANLSGGQKQRLSIARALARRPEIYVFDDSFSALDFKTDAMLRAALKKETRDAAVIIVAQRVSTVMDADRILVLDDGAQVGLGTHRDLMRSCPVYREIVLSQISEEEAG